MKKLVAVLLLAVASTSAMAQHYGHGGHGIRHGHNHHHHHHHRGYYGGNNWVAPLIIGSTLGYVLSRPAPVYVEPPVYVQPHYPIVAQPQCTRYIYQDQYGQVIREEIRCN